jgi:hypothetical protein
MDPALTAAVNVTTVPAVTDMTEAPDEVTASVVEVIAGAVLTVTAREVVATRAPEVPVMVSVDVPGVAELLAESVSTLDPVAGF